MFPDVSGCKMFRNTVFKRAGVQGWPVFFLYDQFLLTVSFLIKEVGSQKLSSK